MKAVLTLGFSLLLPLSLPAQSLAEGVSFGSGALAGSPFTLAANPLTTYSPALPEGSAGLSLGGPVATLSATGQDVQLNWTIAINPAAPADQTTAQLGLNLSNTTENPRQTQISTGVEFGWLGGRTHFDAPQPQIGTAAEESTAYGGLRVDAVRDLGTGQSLRLGMRYLLTAPSSAGEAASRPALELGLSHRLQW